MRVMLGKSAKTYTTGEGGKLDGVATLVTGAEIETEVYL